MKFISYAQNFEDVILNRAFKGRDSGFYIDVGACHPTNHSVTKSFYDRGWSGINIEPASLPFALLRAERPRDVNRNVGVSDREGRLTLYEAPTSVGRSTFSADWRAGWSRLDGCEFVERTVPVTTLARICEQHADRPIDFLKVDVEGHEREVLAGADFARWRPRVVLVEGDADAWEDLLSAADYRFAAFDGINRYYARAEDAALIPALAAPVSILDDFALHEYLQPIENLQAALADALSRDEAKGRELAEATARLEELASRLRAFDDLGPATLRVARRLRHAAHQHPRLSAFVKRLLRVK